MRLLLTGRRLRALQAQRATLCCEQSGHVGKLLRLQGEQLVAGLRRLKRARGILAGRHQRAHLRLRRREIADDCRLRLERVLKAGPRVLLTGLCIGDQLC